MSLRNLDLNIQKSNPNHYQVLKGSLGALDFSLISDFIYDNGRPATRGSREVARMAGAQYDAALHGLKKEADLQEGYAVLCEAGNLPSSGILHMIVPLVYENKQEFLEFLWSCHWNSLALAYDYLVKHELSSLTLAFDVMEGLSLDAAKHTIAALSKQYRLYPKTRKVQVVFVCSDAQSYTNLKEAVQNEKYS